MKIMLVNTYYYPEIVGGAEYSVKKLAEALKQAGHTVVVLCTGDAPAREIIDGIDVIRIKVSVPCRAIRISDAPAHIKAISRVKGIWNIGNKSIIKEILWQEKPDVIHTNGLYDISPIIWKIAKEQGIKVVHTLRDYYLCCPLVSMECEEKEEKCRFQNNLCPVHRKANKKALSKFVDYITAPSSITLNKILETLNIEKIDSEVIPNAIDFEKNDVLRILNSKNTNETIKFVYLGTLSEKKGIRWMLESFSEVEQDDIELYIAGKGELIDVVKEYCVKDNRIHFVGFLSEKEMNQLLEHMDVLVCPSLWDEPFGRVVLDAYKHAMPVIASNKGALKEIVKNNITGIVVNTENPKELSEAVLFFANNREAVLNMGYQATLLLDNYSLSTQVEQFVSIYTQIVE